jgi:L-erythro-3,5-diaminohexanoate dehydrogenase
MSGPDATPPVVGAPGGEHRVLEPAGATTGDARRLDALADLWDGELRVDLEALVLAEADLAAWHERVGGGPEALVASLTETMAERGGLDGEPGMGTYVGTITAVGRAHPWPARIGERVALASPAVAVPAFVVASPWDPRSPVVPVRGHAIAPAGVPTVLVPPDASATAARWLALLADVPAAIDDAIGRPADPAVPTVVLGGGSPAGAVAVAHLTARGRPVAAVVETLDEARRLRALGADHVVVADLAAAVGSAAVVAGEVPARDATVVLADPRAAGLAVRLAARVLTLVDTGPPADPATQGVLAARSVTVVAHRWPGRDRGVRVVELVASSPSLAAVLGWHHGAPFPPATDREPAPWERP